MPIRFDGNLKHISGNSLSLFGTQNKDIRELKPQMFLVPRTPTGSIFAAWQPLRLSRRSWVAATDFKTRFLRLKQEVQILGSSKSIRHTKEEILRPKSCFLRTKEIKLHANIWKTFSNELFCQRSWWFHVGLLNDLHLARKQRARSSSAPPAMPSVNQDRLVLKFPIGAASQTLLYTGVKLRLRPWLRKWRPHLTLQGSRPLQFSQKIPVYSLLIWHGIVLWSICGYVTSVFTFCQGLLRVSRWVSVITCFLVMPSCSRVWLSWFQLTSKYFNRLQPCEGNTAQVYSRTSSNSHLSTNGHFFWRTVHTLAREQHTHFRSSLLRPEIRLLFHRQSIHWLLFKPLYNGHFLLSPRWPLWRGSTVLFLD